MQRLHRFNPVKFTSPLCPICRLEIEDSKHMLFSCPQKQTIWTKLNRELLWLTVNNVDIYTALYAYDVSSISYCQKPIAVELVIFITISQIWRQYYRCIFENQNFDTYVTYKKVQYAIQSEIDRSTLSSDE